MAKLAIIPARGGSKRIPKKNIRLFMGEPIIGYAIKAAMDTGLFDHIMISTDDSEIAEVGKLYGAEVPFMRSRSNADDFATLTDVVLEVLQRYNHQGREFEDICLLFPTAALITAEKIKEAHTRFKEYGYTTLVPVIRYAYPIQRALVHQEGRLRMREENHINTRSQDLEPCFHDSGQFYWIRSMDFLREPRIFSHNTGYIELKELEAQDVDTMEDWAVLELKYNLKKKNGY